MKVNQATHAVGTMCRLLGISRSGFYAWMDRPMSVRRREDLSLTAKIVAIHRRSRDTYGSPNIHAELADEHGVRVGRKRVARLMRESGLRGATLRKYVVTTLSDPQAKKREDLVERRFFADAPDRLWVADITYIPTWSGWLYLAMVLDVYSRKIVGWAMDTHMRTALILDALQMAVTQRQPRGVIHHSGHGSQGEFQRSLQHPDAGGVVWVDHQDGLQSELGAHRCVRRADRVLIKGRRNRRSGSALQQEIRVKRQRWRAVCHSPSVRAGFAKQGGWRPSVWGRRQDDTCPLRSERNWRC